VVFRNGLKDYEVLPPAEAWNNIRPFIKTKKKAFIFLRVAAISAVLMMIGFLAYWLGNDLSTSIDNAVTALNENPAPMVITRQVNSPLYVIPKDGTGSSEDVVLDELPDLRNLITDVPDQVSPGKTENISIYNQDQAGSSSAVLKTPETVKYNSTEPFLLFPDEKPVINREKRWSIAALASPTYNSRLNSINDDLSRQLDASESPGNSYSGGITVAFKVNRRFSIQSGLFYSSMGKEVDGISSFAGFERYVTSKGSHNFEVLTTNGSVLTNNSDVFLMSATTGDRIITNYTRDFFDPEKASLDYINNTLNQNFSYLELPISLRYKIIDKTLDFNIIGGISYNLLVKNSVYAKVDGGKFPIGHTEGLNPVSISSSFGMGMEYNLSDRFSLNLEPTFRYYLNPINELARTNLRPYSFGIFSGLSYKF
jgi:hypothetical protein